MTQPLVPEYVRSLIPYLPGKPIEETQREFGLKKVIKLASNENPLGPSPKALVAMRKHCRQLHRYPDGSGRALKSALARHAGVSASQVLLGNGSNEIIELIVRTYCVAGDAIVTHRGAFIAYSICAQGHGVRTLEAPVDSDFAWDVEQLLQLVRADERVRIVFLANPNNPTGVYFSAKQHQALVDGLSRIRGGSTVLVLDYAYWEYVTALDLLSPTDVLHAYENTVVLRTFSKVYGLAGLRIGFALGPIPLIAHMDQLREPFNINSLALVAAEAALKDTAFVKKSVKSNTEGMRFWTQALKKLQIPFWSSQGNFLLLNAVEGLQKPAVQIFQDCLPHGVILRPIANYGIPQGLRVTVGTSAENRRAVQVLTHLSHKRP